MHRFGRAEKIGLALTKALLLHYSLLLHNQKNPESRSLITLLSGNFIFIISNYIAIKAVPLAGTITLPFTISVPIIGLPS